MLQELQSFLLIRQAYPMCSGTRTKIKYKKYVSFIDHIGSIAKCQSCNFLYSVEYFTPEGARIFYQKKYTTGNYAKYGQYDILKKLNFKNSFQDIFKMTKQQPAQLRHLDLGCGEGFSTATALSFGLESIGVDIDRYAIQKAQQKGLTAYSAPLENIQELQLGQFDLVTLFDVLDHVYDPVSVMAQVSKSLKPGGFVYLDVNNIRSIYAHFMQKHYIHLIPYEHLSYFSPQTLSNLLKKFSLQPIQIKNHNRKINLHFLGMTLNTFMPSVGKFFNQILKLLPQSLQNKLFGFPIGLMSVVAQKINT